MNKRRKNNADADFSLSAKNSRPAFSCLVFKEETFMQTKIKRPISILLTLVLLFSVFAGQLATTVNAAPAGVSFSKYNGYGIYYSDEYFRHSSTEFDSHLATLSVIMTDNTVPRIASGKVPDAKWYANQPNLLKGFFDTIGFSKFQANADYKKVTKFDTIGLAAASRKIDNFTVIAVTVRSGSYFSEWANNVWLGDGTKSDYMHEGWYNAANRLISFLSDYASSQKIKGRVKVWIAGFSRGGATSNLAAGLLDNKIDQKQKIFSNGATLAHDDLFGYTFEAPQGANYNSKTVKEPTNAIYNNIWNMVNPNDLVTKVAMDQFGFTRFGTDKYITTRFYDPKNFNYNRDATFAAMCKKNGYNYSKYEGDAFNMYKLPLNKLMGIMSDPSGLHFQKVLEKDKSKVHYDANIVGDLLLEELAANYIGSRENYCKKFQDQMKQLMLSIMNDQVTSKVDSILYIFDRTCIALILMAFGQEEYAYDTLEKAVGNTAAADAGKSLATLAGAVAYVYTQRPNEVLSFALQAENVFTNHAFEVNIAHMMAQDSYYTDGSYTDGEVYKTVPLRDNADYGHISFKNYNDFSLHVINNGKTKQVAKLVGHVGATSDVEQCDKGYALGYYIYLSGQERAELFMPVGQKYFINFKNFSMKSGYSTDFKAMYRCIGPHARFADFDVKGCYFVRSSYWKNSVNQNSDFVQRQVSMMQ